jgi:TatD DNase family protein
VALGETGLDYSPAADARWHAAQRDCFALHLEVGRRHDLPVIVHTRAALDDTLDVLRAHRGARGVIHCFTEDEAAARAFVELGFMVSFSGIVTFRNADPLRAVAARVPADMLLVETDAPFLSPVPVRGKPNQPAHVAHVAACLAAVRGCSEAAIADCTSANFARLFGVTLPT